jgi:hypothetical protein
MIFIATAHWADSKWIAPQRKALSTYVGQPHRVFANLEGVGPSFDRSFDYVSRYGGSHPEKLNSLAEAITEEADPDDLIVFLDGDAFPIRDVGLWLPELLSEHPLAAVRRDENAGDVQPHPCFCVCTVGFWNEIGGDWRPGSWLTSDGTEATDVGGRLLTTLTARSIPWRPILRSNSVNPHPVLYGIYERHVYHHGAGFRPPIARADETNVPVAENEDYLFLRTRARGKSLKDLRPNHLPQLVRLARRGIRTRKLDAYIRKEERRSKRIFRQIRSDPEFYRSFEQV